MSLYKTKNYKKNIHSKLGGKCAYCGNEITMDEMTTDHYFPRHLLKPYFLSGQLNGFQNILLPSCFDCNQTKDNLLPEEFKIIFGKDFYFETIGFKIPLKLPYFITHASTHKRQR